jgi:hypothetical protein
MTRTIELVIFRMIHMQCCSALLCWVNPRFPNYCPECGKHVYPDVKKWVVQKSDGTLQLENNE